MITTHNINGRVGWYAATALHNGRRLFAFSDTRQGAFTDVLMQLAFDL